MKNLTQKLVDTIGHPEALIILIPNSMGEAVLIGAFVKHLMEKYDRPVVLGLARHHAHLVANLFPNRCQFIVLSQAAIKQIGFETAGGYLTPGRPFVLDFSLAQDPLFAIGNFAHARGGFGTPFTDIIRIKLGLDQGAPLEQPSMNFLNHKSLDKYDLARNSVDFALLFVGNNTNYPLPDAFWQDAYQKVKAQGVEKILVVQSGSMIRDPNLNLDTFELIDLNCAEAAFHIMHSKFTLSGTNGLMTVAALMLSAYAEGLSPRIHSIATDYACRNYPALRLNFEDAFEYIGFSPLEWVHPELMKTTNRPIGWCLPRRASFESVRKLTNDMFKEQFVSSKFYDDRLRGPFLQKFPDPIPYRNREGKL